MALQADQIQDLITVTLKDLGRLKFTELASTLQEYHALGKLIDQYKVQYQSGTAIQYNIMLNQSGAAKNVGLFESDNVNIADVMTTASIPWRHCTTNYAFERREVQFNATPARIVELVKIRRTDAMISRRVDGEKLLASTSLNLRHHSPIRHCLSPCQGRCR